MDKTFQTLQSTLNKKIKMTTDNRPKKRKRKPNKKTKMLLCSGKEYDPKKNKCICLASGKCIIVERVFTKSGKEQLTIPKQKKDKTTKRRNRLKKKQQAVIKYLGANPNVMSIYFGGKKLTDKSKKEDNIIRTRIEQAFHRKLIDEYRIEDDDLDTYERYLDELSKSRITNTEDNRRRASERMRRNTETPFSQEELLREYVEEVETAESLNPILESDTEDIEADTEQNTEDIEPIEQLTERDFDYTQIQNVSEADTEQNTEDIEDTEETASQSLQSVINKNRFNPPPSTQNIRVNNRSKQREADRKEKQQQKQNVAELTESNIERLQRRLRGDNKKTKYVVDDSGVSITSSELGKIGLIPSLSSLSEKDKESVISLSRSDIKNLLDKIQSNKRYSNDEINKRREPLLNMLEELNKVEKDDEPSIRYTDSLKDFVSEKSNSRKSSNTNYMYIQNEDEDNNNKIETPADLMRAMNREQLENDSNLDTEFFDGYSLKNKLMNGGETPASSMKSSEEKSELIYSSEDSDLSSNEYSEDLEQEYPPLDITKIASSA